MKRVLITGINSYVGNSFAEWIEQYPEEIQVDKISLRGDTWKETDFSKYDSVLHVAGIAHRKETKKNAYLYNEVNRDLTEKVVYKAKNEGVNHFVFLSTMSVYGLTEGVIDENTPLKPKTCYGKSKLQAEQYINLLADDYFKIAILRPPMIYGRNSPGNYQKLSKLAKKNIYVFPYVRNVRSMLYIKNLSEFIRLIIKDKKQGLFFPQNKKYVNTSVMVKRIASMHENNVKLIKKFNPILKLFINRFKIINKIFGNLVYDFKLSDFLLEYNLISFENSIIETEKKEKNEKQIKEK